MSKIFFINVILRADYNKSNILKILQRGTQIGFTYYAHILGELYEDAPVIDAEKACEKVVKAAEIGADDGPSIFVQIGDSTYALLGLIEQEGKLKCRLFGMTPVIQREFENKEYTIDFAVYVRLLLILCDDFALDSIGLYECC